mgnify:CR=1 FL=1
MTNINLIFNKKLIIKIKIIFTNFKINLYYVTMLNYNEILKRVKELVNSNNLNATSFSQKIGFQRSGVSHILSGRNKPSLDFITKIYLNFDNVSLNWLLFGNDNKSIPDSDITDTLELKKPNVKQIESKKIKKIVFIYEDQSFEEYSR